MHSLIKFSFLSLMAIAFIGEALAAPSETSYLIERRNIDRVTDALTLLRRFMDRTMSDEEKCEKYAVLLQTFKTSKVDQFSVAELGLASGDEVRKTFLKLGKVALRDLYIDGIKYFSGAKIDKSMSDLVECLDSKFRKIDFTARSFLNNPELKGRLQQYEAIVSQPLEFLLDPNAKHPTITREQLSQSTKLALADVLGGDLALVEAKFAPAHQETYQRPVAPAAVTSSASATVNSEPARGPVVAPALAPVPAPVASPVNAPVPAGVKAHAHAQAQAQVQAQAPAPAQAQAEVSNPNELSPEELAHLSKVGASLEFLYQALPENAQQADRCEAYSKIFETDPDLLTEDTVEVVTKEASDRISAVGPTAGVFMPAQPIRENFLFTTAALNPRQLASETYFDLESCLYEWAKGDPMIANFINSPEQAKIRSELLQRIDAQPATQ